MRSVHHARGPADARQRPNFVPTTGAARSGRPLHDRLTTPVSLPATSAQVGACMDRNVGAAQSAATPNELVEPWAARRSARARSRDHGRQMAACLSKATGMAPRRSQVDMDRNVGGAQSAATPDEPVEPWAARRSAQARPMSTAHTKKPAPSATEPASVV